MSGHSKWATIHRKKEANDAKRGAAFTKLAMAITVAVRQGGGIGDPNQNFRLRLAVEAARAANMPKENIARAIAKGTGDGGGVVMEEALFEGFLPGGAALLVETVSDNRIRTAQQVRMIVDKLGGTMGSSGAVSYLFSHVGQVVVDLAGKNEEEAELEIMDIEGVQDMESGEGKLAIYCDKSKPFEIKDQLESRGYKVESAELVMKPTTWIEVADNAQREQIEKIIEQLEELDDVAKVWTNYA